MDYFNDELSPDDWIALGKMIRGEEGTSASAEDVFKKYKTQEEIDAEPGVLERGIKGGGGYGNASLMAGAAGLAAKIVGAEDAAQGFYDKSQELAREGQELYPQKVNFDQMLENPSLSNIGEWLGYNVAAAVPMMVASMGVGGLAGLTGRAALGTMAKKAGEEAVKKATASELAAIGAEKIAESAASDFLKTNAARIGTGAAAASMAPVEAGGMWIDDAQKHGVENTSPVQDALFGAGSAGLETLGVEASMLGRLLGKTAEPVLKETADTVLGRLGQRGMSAIKEGGKQFINEGVLEEAGQEGIAMVNEALNAVPGETPDITNMKGVKRLAESGIVGGVAGFAPGTLMGAFRHRTQEKVVPEVKGATDILGGDGDSGFNDPFGEHVSDGFEAHQTDFGDPQNISQPSVQGQASQLTDLLDQNKGQDSLVPDAGGFPSDVMMGQAAQSAQVFENHAKQTEHSKLAGVLNNLAQAKQQAEIQAQEQAVTQSIMGAELLRQRLEQEEQAALQQQDTTTQNNYITEQQIQPQTDPEGLFGLQNTQPVEMPRNDFDPQLLTQMITQSESFVPEAQAALNRKAEMAAGVAEKIKDHADPPDQVDPEGEKKRVLPAGSRIEWNDKRGNTLAGTITGVKGSRYEIERENPQPGQGKKTFLHTDYNIRELQPESYTEKEAIFSGVNTEVPEAQSSNYGSVAKDVAPEPEQAIIPDIPETSKERLTPKNEASSLLGAENEQEEYAMFPMEEAKKAYQSRSNSPLNSAKAEKETFDSSIESLRKELEDNGVDADSVKADVDAFSQKYLDERRKVWSVGSGVVSPHIAGGSDFNSKQATSRGLSLDNAEDSFFKWEQKEKEAIFDRTGVTSAKQADTEEKELSLKEKTTTDAVRQFMALKPGDTFNPGGNNDLVVKKKNRMSIETESGSKYTVREITGLKPENANEIMKRLETEQASGKDEAAVVVSNPKLDRFEATAKKLIEDAEAREGAGRLTNTDRRADMAAHATEKALDDKRIGETMLKVAEHVRSGKSKYLAGITSKSDIKQLDSIMRRAVSETERKTKSYADRDNARKFNDTDVSNIEYPHPVLHVSGLQDIAKDMKGKRGGAAIIGQINTIIRRYPHNDSFVKLTSEDAVERTRELLKRVPDSYSKKLIQERISGYDRMKRMGIHDRSSLEKAIGELASLDSGIKKEDPVKTLEREIYSSKNIGLDFFPTSKEVATDLAERLDVKPGMAVLEPSAGSGRLIDAVKGKEPGAKIEAVEQSSKLRELLKARGDHVVDHDFMDLDKGRTYDRIIMNPPFSNGIDIDHVKKAYDHLKPGGKIVAIMGEGAFFRNDKKASGFREWLDEVGGSSEKLPDGSFNHKDIVQKTGVNSRVVEIKKPLTERRKDTDRRKRIAEMSTEEMKLELLTNPVSGIPNKRALEEANPKPIRISIDVDSLKFINDTLGHQAGDELLKLVGQALQNSSSDEFEVFHVSGDEFLAHANTESAAEGAIKKANDMLKSKAIEVEAPDGTILRFENPQFSYGKGETYEQADERLRQNKKDRENSGERAGRGEEPKGMVRIPAKGVQELQDSGQGAEGIADDASVYYVEPGNKKNMLAAIDEAIKKAVTLDDSIKDQQVEYWKPEKFKGTKATIRRVKGSSVGIVDHGIRFEFGETGGYDKSGQAEFRVIKSFASLAEAKNYTEAFLRGKAHESGTVTFKGKSSDYIYKIPNSVYHLERFKKNISKASGIKYSLSDSKNVSGSGISSKQVTEALKQAEGIMAFEVVQKESELPDHVSEDIKAKGFSGRAEALFDPETNKIYFIADNIGSEKAAQTGFLENLFRHEGRHSVIPQMFESKGARNLFMDRAARLFKGDVDEYLDKNGLEKNVQNIRMASEEVLVNQTVKGGVHAILDDFIGKVVKWARKIFPNLSMTKAEARDFIRRADSMLKGDNFSRKEGFSGKSDGKGLLKTEKEAIKYSLKDRPTTLKDIGLTAEYLDTKILDENGEPTVTGTKLVVSGNFRAKYDELMKVIGGKYRFEKKAGGKGVSARNVYEFKNPPETIENDIADIIRAHHGLDDMGLKPKFREGEKGNRLFINGENLHLLADSMRRIGGKFVKPTEPGKKPFIIFKNPDARKLFKIATAAKEFNDSMSRMMKLASDKAENALNLIVKPKDESAKATGKRIIEDIRSLFSKSDITLPSNNTDFVKGLHQFQTETDIAKNDADMKALYEINEKYNAIATQVTAQDREASQDYYDLGKDERKPVNKALLACDEERVKLTDGEVKERFGLSDKQIKGFRAIRNVLDNKLTQIVSDMVKHAFSDLYLDDDMAREVLARNIVDSDSRKNIVRLLKEHGVSDKQAENVSWLFDWINERKGYIPHKWDSEWLVRVNMPDGETYLLDVPTVTGNILPTKALREGAANKAAVRVIKERIGWSNEQIQEWMDNGNITLVKSKEPPLDLFHGASMHTMSAIIDSATERAWEEQKDAFSTEQLMKQADLKASIRKEMEELFLAKGAGRHFIARKGVKGFREDIDNIMSEYIGGINSWMVKRDKAMEFSKAMGNIDPKNTPEKFKHARAFVDDMLGESQEAGWFKKFAGIWFLGADVSAAALNAFQNYTHAAPLMMRISGNEPVHIQLSKAMKDSFNEWKAAKKEGRAIFTGDSKFISKEEGEIVRNLFEQGFFDPAVMGEQTGFHPSKIWNNYADKTTKALMYMFTGVEALNRSSAFIAAYRRAKAAGISDPVQTAKQIVIDAHYAGGKQNRPLIVRRMGAVGNIGYTFMMFPVNNLFFLKDMFKELFGALYSKDKARIATELKVVGSHLGALFTLGGLSAMPFASIMAPLVKGIFSDDDDDWEVALRKHLPPEFGRLMVRGLPAVLGNDMSGRVSSDVLGMPAGFGVMNTMYKRALKAGDYAVQGEYLDSVMAISPDFIRNPYNAIMGMTEGGEKRGRSPVKYTGFQAVLKGAGFSPTAETEAYAAKQSMDRVKEKRSSKLEDFAEELLQLQKKKDSISISNLRKRVSAYNELQKKDDDPVIKWSSVIKSARQRDRMRNKGYLDRVSKGMKNQKRAALAAVGAE